MNRLTLRIVVFEDNPFINNMLYPKKEKQGKFNGLTLIVKVINE
jgi:hypothetical protein